MSKSMVGRLFHYMTDGELHHKGHEDHEGIRGHKNKEQVNETRKPIAARLDRATAPIPRGIGGVRIGPGSVFAFVILRICSR